MNIINNNLSKYLQKSALLILSTVYALFLMLPGCNEQNLFPRQDQSLITTKAQSDDPFYYYYGEKFFIPQLKDKIYIRFAPDADIEQVRSLIGMDTLTLQPMYEINWDEFHLWPPHYGFRTVLKTIDGNPISTEIIEHFRNSPVVVSVAYLLGYKEHEPQYISFPNEFIVKLKETTSYEQLQTLTEQYGCTVGKEFTFTKNIFIVNVSKHSKTDAMQTANLFYETGIFEYSHANFAYFNALSSNDTYFPQQWGLSNTGQSGGTPGVDIGAVSAWTLTTGSPNIRIAIIDDGVDLSHPDLQANLVTGYDSFYALIFYMPPGWPMHVDDYHGTAVAGIAGAVQNNSLGVSGVAPNCKIIPVRVADASGIILTDLIADGFDWAWQHEADVINFSVASASFNQAVKDAIDRATSNGRLISGAPKGCVIVAASGNSNTSVYFPANQANVIGVGAITNKGQRKSDSNYGNDLNVVAPGDAIYTTDMQATGGFNTSSGTAGNYYSNFNGTSAATPFVSGVAALILSVRPDLTWSQVQQTIETTAKKLPGFSFNISKPNGSFNSDVGYGLVQAYVAVNTVMPKINGPDVISTSCSGTYTITSIPASGVTNQQWSVIGGGVTPTSGLGTSFTITRTANVNDPEVSNLRFSYTYNGQTYTVYKNVINRILPVIAGASSSLYGVPQDFVYYGLPAYFQSDIPYDERQYILEYQWDITTNSSGGHILLSGQNTSTPVYFPGSGQYQVSLRVRDGCGWSRWEDKYIQVY